MRLSNIIALVNQKEYELKSKAVTGGKWNMLSGIWQTILKLVSSIVLARILTPNEFGILAAALLIFGLFSQITVLSASAGIIAKKTLSQIDLSTAFWFNFFVQFILFIVTFFSAPLFSSFFDMPDLTIIVRILSIKFILSSLSSVQNTILARLLKFKTIALVNALGIFIEVLTGLILVYIYSKGVLGLVYAIIFSELILCFIWIYLISWMPCFKFHKKSFYYFFNYGINLLGENVTIYLRQNVDYLLVGKVLGSETLGLYSFAYRIPNLISTKLATPIASLSLPVLSKVSQDDNLIMDTYFKMLKYLIYITFPILGVLFFGAYSIVYILWGTTWLTIVSPLKILVGSAAISVLAYPIGGIFLAKGMPNFLFKFGVVKLLFCFLSVGFLGFFYDINGVAWGMVISTFPFFYQFYYALKITKSNFNEYFGIIKPSIQTILFAILFTLVFTYLTTPLIHNKLFVSLLSGSVFLFSFLFFLRIKYKNEFFNIIGLLIKKKK